MLPPPPSLAARVRLARVWLTTIGRPAMARAVPAWGGAAIVAGLILGGNGVGARDLAAIVAGAPRVAGVVAIAWCVLLWPAVRATVDAAGLGFLRSLPGAPPLEALARATVIAAVHAPFAALAIVAAGGGGAAVWAAAIAASWLAAATIARVSTVPRRPRWGTAIGALCGAHLRAVMRRRGGALAMGLGLALLAGALGAALVRSADVAPLASGGLVAACAAVAIPCALVAIATAVVEDEHGLGPWIAAAGASAAAPPARAITLAAWGTALGAAVGVAVAAIGAPSPDHLGAILGSTAATGAGVGLAMTAAARRALVARRPAQSLGGHAAGIALGGVVAIGALSTVGVIAVVGVGAALASGGRRG